MVDKVSEFTKDQLERVLYYVSVVEQVVEQLARELSFSSGDLNSLLDDLRHEVDSIRGFMNEHTTEYQKLLVKMGEMSQEVKKLLENGNKRFRLQADEPTALRSIKEEQCTDFQRPSDEKYIECIKLLMDEKQKAEKSLKIEKERMISQANELASLRSALNDNCTETEKLLLLLEIEKERTQADELASIRSAVEEKCAEYQNLVMDERQKAANAIRQLKIQKAISESLANQLALRSAEDELLTEQGQDSTSAQDKLLSEQDQDSQRYFGELLEELKKHNDGGQVSGATYKRKREKNQEAKDER